MMHIGLAMRVCGGIVHLCPVQELSWGDQHRQIGAPSELIGAIMSTPTTINTSFEINAFFFFVWYHDVFIFVGLSSVVMIFELL